MEFSDDYSSFQLQPLQHRISQDFSTDFASGFKLKRTRSRNSTSLSSRKDSQGSSNSDRIKFDRRTYWSVSFVVIILIAILLPNFQASPSSEADLYDKYITVVDRPKIVKKEIDTASNAEALKSVQAALEMKQVKN